MSAKIEPTVGIEVDMGHVRMVDYKKFLKATTTSDIDEMNIFYSLVVTAIPFTELSPADVETYDTLTIEQWYEIAAAVGKKLADKFNRKN